MKLIVSALALAFALAAAPDSFARTRIAGESAAAGTPAGAKSAKSAKPAKKAKKDGTRQSTWTGPDGRQATATTTRSGGDVSTIVTGPESRTATRVVDREPGLTNVTTTGPDGRTVTRTTTH